MISTGWNDCHWFIDWNIYAQKNLSITEGDEVEISAISHNRYLMTIQARDGTFESIIFMDRPFSNGDFHAVIDSLP